MAALTALAQVRAGPLRRTRSHCIFTGMLAVKQGPDSLKGILDETVKSDHFYEIFTLDFTSF